MHADPCTAAGEALPVEAPYASPGAAWGCGKTGSLQGLVKKREPCEIKFEYPLGGPIPSVLPSTSASSGGSLAGESDDSFCQMASFSEVFSPPDGSPIVVASDAALAAAQSATEAAPGTATEAGTEPAIEAPAAAPTGEALHAELKTFELLTHLRTVARRWALYHDNFFFHWDRLCSEWKARKRQGTQGIPKSRGTQEVQGSSGAHGTQGPHGVFDPYCGYEREAKDESSRGLHNEGRQGEAVTLDTVDILW